MPGRRKAVPRLGEGELEILQMLWRTESATISEAQDALGLPIGYTTVQTRLNRLVNKGVAAKTSERPARYSAAVTPDQVHARDLDTLVERVSNGRVTPLVAHLVSREDLSSEEFQELKALIADAERRSQSTQKRGAE